MYDKLVTKVNAIDTSGLFKKTNFTGKITEIEGKIPRVTGLATTAALNTVKSKILNVNYLMQRENKKKLVNRSDISRFINKNISSKAELKQSKEEK